jgi:periplasmic divalent cation tolerance protein
MATDALIVYCTLPDNDDDAARIARALVEAKLAACVNLVPGLRSIYRWKEDVCDDSERLAIIKTTADRFDALRVRLIDLHPYDCPEVIALPVERGHDPYLDWIRASTR